MSGFGDPDGGRLLERLYHYPPASLEYVAERLNIAADGFYSKILFAIPHADRENLERIRLAWPWLVAAWERWQASPTGEFEADDLTRP